MNLPLDLSSRPRRGPRFPLSVGRDANKEIVRDTSAIRHAVPGEVLRASTLSRVPPLESP
jgi:hypothetical protein